MKNWVFSLITVSFFSSSAFADVIKCNFTEPFADTMYSMAQQSLTIHSPNDPKSRVINDVSFQIKGPGQFVLVDKDGKVLQELTLDMKGSDGMSDSIYPYEVKDYTVIGPSSPQIGACSSNYLKARND